MCSMEYRFVQDCVIYVDSAVDKLCDYPCSFINCQSELHHFTMCPTWFCTPKTTTTPTPDISTLSPLPPPLPTHPSSSLVTSIAFNALFGLILLTPGAMYLVRRRRARALANFYGQVNPLFVESQGPIIRNSERIPLLNRETETSSTPHENLPQNLPNFYEQIQAAVLPVPMQETSF